MIYLLYIGNYEPTLVGLFTSKKRAEKVLSILSKNNPDMRYVNAYIKPMSINKLSNI